LFRYDRLLSVIVRFNFIIVEFDGQYWQYYFTISVAMHLKCDGILFNNHLIADLLLSVAVNEL